jgi:hypothetical protein
MTRSRWLLSVAFIAHLAAIGLGSVPPPDILDRSAPGHLSDSAIVAAVSPLLDSAAARIYRIHTAIWDVTAPVRGAADAYLGMFRLQQTWSMFWNPPVVDKYLRIRYYVSARTPDGAVTLPIWTAMELVLPIDREDRIRPLHRYGNVSGNKAIATAIDAFQQRRRRTELATGPGRAPLPDDLSPVLRYFANEFQRGLPATERVTRAEAWYGSVRNPRPGSPDASRQRDRRLALSRYYDGPVEDREPIRSYPYVGTTQQESDILWVLEYVEDL